MFDPKDDPSVFEEDMEPLEKDPTEEELDEEYDRDDGDQLDEPNLEADEDWRQEIAREEGMLNGIDSFNDWMGY
jgi:hypothetical protein